MRLDRLRGFAPWFAFAGPALLLLAWIWVLLAFIWVITDYGPGSPIPPEVNPAWIGAAEVGADVCLGVSLLCLLMVALSLAWSTHAWTKTPLAYVGVIAAVVSILAYLLFLLDQLFKAGNFLYFAAYVLLVAATGACLVAMNLLGRGGGLLGRMLPWIGIAAGCLFLLAALSILAGFGGGVTAALVAAIPLYTVWSVWLGFRLRADRRSVSANSASK